jgi:hypothetical protein
LIIPEHHFQQPPPFPSNKSKRQVLQARAALLQPMCQEAVGVSDMDLLTSMWLPTTEICHNTARLTTNHLHHRLRTVFERESAVVIQQRIKGSYEPLQRKEHVWRDGWMGGWMDGRLQPLCHDDLIPDALINSLASSVGLAKIKR